MRRNVLHTNTAVETMNENAAETKTQTAIEIPDECIDDFINAIEIGYYKDFYKQGLITNQQLEILMQMKSEKTAWIIAPCILKK